MMPPDVPPPPTPPAGAPPAPTPGAVIMVDRKGQRHEVPAEQATQAFQSGQFGFTDKEVATVDASGRVGMRGVHELAAALGQGESIASREAVHQAHIEAKYGGVGGTLAAAGEGLVRGASLGLSDPLAVGAARLFGGDENAEKVRTHLAEEKEAHGIVATGSELLGAAAPMLLSGGATAPEQAATLGARSAIGAAGEAGIFGRIAEGIKTLGALPRGVGMAGDAAEHAVSGLLGTSGSALGKAGISAAKTAARAVTEAGLFGGGEEISQDTLKNAPLTAEKLFSAVGHTALMGGILGGSLAAAGSLAGSAASAAMGAAGPKLDDLRGYQLWKWLSPRNAEAKLAARAGGPSAVGNTAWELAFRPAVQEKGIGAVASMSHEEKLGLVQDALDGVGKKIAQVDSSGATIPLQEFLAPIEKRMSKYQDTILGQDKVAALQTLRDDVVRILGSDLQEQEVGKLARKASLDAGYEAGSDAGQQFEAQYAKRLHAGGAYDIGDAPVPLAAALKQRRALQQIAFGESKAMDPKLRVEILREVSGEWNDLEAKALDQASAKGEGITGDQFRALNKQFQQLKVAETTLQNTTSRYAANNSLSLSDNLYGAAHLGGAIASGHPMGALGAVATSYGHKLVRTQGNAYAAVLLDRLSTWGGVARATADVDGAVDRAIAKVVRAPERGVPRIPRTFSTDTADEHSEDAYETARERVASAAAMAPGLIASHLQERTSSLQTHAPNVAAALQQQTQRANAYLAKAMPPLPPIDPLQGKRPKGSGVSAPLQNGFLRRYHAVEGGPERALERLGRGQLSLEDVETLQNVFPESLPEIQTKLRSACADAAMVIPYQRRIQIAMLLGAPTDTTMDPVAGRELQHMSPELAEPAQTRSKEGPAKLAIQESLQTPTERAAASA